MPDDSLGTVASDVGKGAALGSIVPGVGTLIGAGAGAVLGTVQALSNAAKERRDKAALENMKLPFYKIQNEYYQNRNMAGINAETGLPSATKDYITSEAQKGLGAGISGTLQSGGNPNDISKLLSQYNKNIDATGAQDAENHIKNIQYFQEANRALAAQKNIQFGFNKVQPYQRKLGQLTQNISNEQVNENNGITTALGSINAGITGTQNDALLKQFKTQNKLLDKLYNGESPNITGLSLARTSDTVGTMTQPLNVGGVTSSPSISDSDNSDQYFNNTQAG